MARTPIPGPSRFALAATALTAAAFVAACGERPPDPRDLEPQYGVSGAYSDKMETPDGRMSGTVVPVTQADGRTAQLFLPAARKTLPHAVYLRDDNGLYPVQVTDDVNRDDVVQHPVVVQKRAEPPPPIVALGKRRR